MQVTFDLYKGKTCHHESHAPAVSVDVQVQPQTVLVTAINIVAKDGYSINAD